MPCTTVHANIMHALQEFESVYDQTGLGSGLEEGVYDWSTVQAASPLQQAAVTDDDGDGDWCTTPVFMQPFTPSPPPRSRKPAAGKLPPSTAGAPARGRRHSESTSPAGRGNLAAPPGRRRAGTFSTPGKVQAPARAQAQYAGYTSVPGPQPWVELFML